MALVDFVDDVRSGAEFVEVVTAACGKEIFSGARSDFSHSGWKQRECWWIAETVIFIVTAQVDSEGLDILIINWSF